MLVTRASVEKLLKAKSMTAEQITEAFLDPLIMGLGNRRPEFRGKKIGAKIAAFLESFLDRGEVIVRDRVFTHVTHIAPPSELYILKQGQQLKESKVFLPAGRILRWVETLTNEYLMEVPGTELRGLFHSRQLTPYEVSNVGN